MINSFFIYVGIFFHNLDLHLWGRAQFLSSILFKFMRRLFKTMDHAREVICMKKLISLAAFKADRCRLSRRHPQTPTHKKRDPKEKEPAEGQGSQRRVRRRHAHSATFWLAWEIP